MSVKDPRVYWDEKAADFASGERRRRSGRFRELYEACCWRYIEPLLPSSEGTLILEAGCGTGRWVMRLAPMGYRMVLSDLSPEMIRHARENVMRNGISDYVVDYQALDICDMHTLSEGRFDLILALGVPLTLCSDAEKAAKEMDRVTKPGGHVICDASNRYRTALELAREDDYKQFSRVLDTGQITRKHGLTHHHFTPQELTGLFEARGMEVVRLAAVCPFFEFPPREGHVKILDDASLFETIQDVFRRYAEDVNVISLSARLLVVARKRA